MIEHDDSTTPVNVNAGLADGLREISDWLERNPNLPPFVGYVSHWAFHKDSSRESLTQIATALGDCASESVTELGDVQIIGQFGEASVRASAHADHLGGNRVEIVYDPILPAACDTCAGSGVAGGPDETGACDPCERCSGTGSSADYVMGR